MRCTLPVIVAFVLLLNGCASDKSSLTPTLASLEGMSINMKPKANFEISRQKVIESYRALVQISGAGSSSGDELRRLADLELEASLDNRLSDDTLAQQQGQNESTEAIAGYQKYLAQYPQRKDNDHILYQLSRAYSLEAESEKSLEILDQLTTDYPDSSYLDEAQFRRGENLFVLRRYEEAEAAYGVVVEQFPDSVYFEKALYKYGWSQFKQSHYEAAIDSYLKLLDINAKAKNVDEFGLSPDLSRAEQELLEDVVTVTSLAFSYEAENNSIADYFAQTGHRSYEPLLYLRLGELYLSKQRITDGADMFLFFGEQYPLSRYAPEFHQKAIVVYEKAGYSNLLLKEKIAFVNRFDVNSTFWNAQNLKSRSDLEPTLSTHLQDLATHFHAQARVSGKAVDFQTSADWYRRFLSSFPQHRQAPEMNFLLSESLYEAGQYSFAVEEYETTAYHYERHKNAAEAGYAALIAYDKILRTTVSGKRPPIAKKRIESAIKFTRQFPDDSRVSAVLLQTAQQFFTAKNYQQSSRVAYQLTQSKGLDKKTQLSAWTLIADSHFSANEFQAAEQAYTTLIVLLPKNSKQNRDIQQQIAASIYRQGELARDRGDHITAAAHFSRLGQVVPDSPTRIIAEYDATSSYIELKDWPTAIAKLELFRKTYPGQKKWKTGVTEKLALAYSENGNQALAAREMMSLAVATNSQSRKKDLMWRAAELYQASGNQDQAIKIYKTYVRTYPFPLARSIELRHKIADSYLATNDTKKRRYWLNEIVRADAAGKSQRTGRTKFLAATASLELTRPLRQSYEKVKLTVPLKTSLAKKKKLMQQSLKAYTRAIKYQVQEVTTEATFLIAEIYLNFANALLKSERPKGLDQEQLEEYDLLLEEQAYPFEEKAIDIHLSNYKRIATGTYDESTQKSLKALGQLMPFRYAKMEVSEAYVEIQ